MDMESNKKKSKENLETIDMKNQSTGIAGSIETSPFLKLDRKDTKKAMQK